MEVIYGVPYVWKVEENDPIVATPEALLPSNISRMDMTSSGKCDPETKTLTKTYSWTGAHPCVGGELPPDEVEDVLFWLRRCSITPAFWIRPNHASQSARLMQMQLSSAAPPSVLSLSDQQ